MFSRKNYLIAGIMLIVGILCGWLAARSGQQPIPQCCGESSNPPAKDLLTIAQARRYVENYAPHAGVIRIAHPGHKDSVSFQRNSRCIWFPAWRLRALLCQIEKDKGNGVRFYFATYDSSYNPHSELEPTPKHDYWGHNTLVLVSTKDSAGYSWDYFNAPGLGTAPNGFMITIDPENHGELCPPPSNCIAEGATLLGYMGNTRK
ncbi:hypothetical protein GFS24_05130 [Chitinophaga sp. SYP-B3965]|uniref:hypothetical protein n=1 Tax=Chitinophaga sp. SYP-B3965 TaxID=2663120 RepID=UPI0012997E0A|nr:hypothetical protein [Chitinophaga sp. SYP-B3965]MRG44483.1 hypothetical protein [Chitinophaga sp. SYP-B3965]